LHIRHGLILLLICSGFLPASALGESRFGLEEVAGLARALASEPFRPPEPEVPQWLTEISYDEWRDIRFRPERTLWRESGSRFQVQLFHPGLFYDRTVKIHTVEAQGLENLEFSPSHFDYGKNDFASRVPHELGYAGFRLHYPLNAPDRLDELIVFLGASYLRSVGEGQGFGLSARGLAIDTAEPEGEEFPYFREFWLVRPSPDAEAMEVYALLDSPRVAGAYHFVIRPGLATVVSVNARLFLREPLSKLGIAPLTSMFFHGENTQRFFDDFRPEVHDSDGLLIEQANGEWLWRPLDNPERLQVRAFRAVNPRGFGLVQRDRDFDHYQDLETRQERRPSLWIEPEDDWGAGRVELVEIPTPSDANDNIVAYWVPDELPAAGEPISLRYRMRWHADDAAGPPGGRAVATRRDSEKDGSVHRFVVDFAGQKLAKLSASRVLHAAIGVHPVDSARAKLIDQQLQKSPIDASWRLVFRVLVENDGPIELRAALEQSGQPLTETWTYTLEP
jgi:periplasmic glucans biosynthesis protein